MRRRSVGNKKDTLKAFKVLGLSTELPIMTFVLAYIGYMAFGWQAILPFGLLGYFLGIISMFAMIRQLEKVEKKKY